MLHFYKQNSRVWEFLTASLEERNSKRNRELENFANFGSRVCEDLVYVDGPIPVKVIKFITYFHSWRMAISRSIFLRSNEPNISTLKYSLNFFNSELLHIDKE